MSSAEFSGFDWVGIVVHCTDGRLMLLQMDQPRGEIGVEAEFRETTWDDPKSFPMWRTHAPTGVRTAHVKLDGVLLTSEQHFGDRPDWARVKREIEAGQPAIEDGQVGA